MKFLIAAAFFAAYVATAAIAQNQPTWPRDSYTGPGGGAYTGPGGGAYTGPGGGAYSGPGGGAYTGPSQNPYRSNSPPK